MRIITLAAGAAVALALTSGAYAQQVGDAAAGKQVFNKCRACHAIGPGAKNRIGPYLNGVVGEKPGEPASYNFSTPFKQWAADKTAWNEDLLDKWLTDPRAVVKGTKMVFPGLKDEKDRINVITYLASFDADGKSQDPAAALKAAASK
ncbi:cytochrome c family protein [Jiella sp. M17.18]|uniref:c-type cytochrome n=1 Tax=Jiella sp. M17.18 TaxID=3234247 RepID=UPI0034DF0BE5